MISTNACFVGSFVQMANFESPIKHLNFVVKASLSIQTTLLYIGAKI
jgi:hypothetical protein